MGITQNRPLKQRDNCLGCLVLAKDMQEVAFCALKYPIDSKGVKDKGVLFGELDDKHRRAVTVWTRHADNFARAENREWFGVHGTKFVRRWATVSCLAWAGAWVASEVLLLEVPLVLIGFGSGSLALFFQYLRCA